MRCLQCNNEQQLTTDAKFCRICGSPLPLSEVEPDLGKFPQATRILSSPPRLAVSPPASSHSKQLQSEISLQKDTSSKSHPLPSDFNRSEEVDIQVKELEIKSISPEEFSLAPPTNVLIGPFEQAGFGLRFGAAMFDFTVFIIWLFVVVFLSGIYPGMISFLVGTLGFILLFLFNLIFLPIKYGQTLGKWIIGIRIIHSDFSPVGASSIIKRHTIGYLISSFCFMFGFIWVLWDRRQQGWHDKFAHTLVIRLDI